MPFGLTSPALLALMLAGCDGGKDDTAPPEADIDTDVDSDTDTFSCDPICVRADGGCICTGCCLGTPMTYNCNPSDCSCSIDGTVFFEAPPWACFYESESDNYVGGAFAMACGVNIDPWASSCP